MGGGGGSYSCYTEFVEVQRIYLYLSICLCFVDNWSVFAAEIREFSVEDTKINWVVGYNSYNSSSKYRISTARKYFMTEFLSSALQQNFYRLVLETTATFSIEHWSLWLNISSIEQAGS